MAMSFETNPGRAVASQGSEELAPVSGSAHGEGGRESRIDLGTSTGPARSRRPDTSADTDADGDGDGPVISRDEAVALLRGGAEGVREWNRRRKAGEAIPALLGIDLSEADLRKADLRGAALSEATLGGAKIGGIKL